MEFKSPATSLNENCLFNLKMLSVSPQDTSQTPTHYIGFLWHRIYFQLFQRCIMVLGSHLFKFWKSMCYRVRNKGLWLQKPLLKILFFPPAVFCQLRLMIPFNQDHYIWKMARRVWHNQALNRW